MPINASESSDGKKVTIHISGCFDFASHQAFVSAYLDHPRGEKAFIVDLQHVEHMDSAAMGMLLQLREHGVRDQTTELINGSDDIRDILRSANFDKIFKVA